MEFNDEELNELVSLLTQYIDQEIQKKANVIYKSILKKINTNSVNESSKTILREKLRNQIFKSPSNSVFSPKQINDQIPKKLQDIDINKSILEGKDVVEELIKVDYRQLLKEVDQVSKNKRN